MPNTHRRPMKVLCLHGLTENTSVMEHKLTPMIQHLPSNTFEFIYVSAPYVLPAVGGAAVPHGTLNLQHNAEARIQEDKEFNKACTAISYLLAAHHNIGADRERSQSDNVPEIHHLIPEYTAVLDDIDEDTRRRAEEHILFDSNTSKRWWTLPSKVDKLSPYIGQETGLAHISKAMREQGPFDGVIGFSTGAMMAAFCQSLLTNSIENSVDPSFQPPEDQTPFKFAIYFTPWLLQNGPHSRHFDALLKNTDTRTHTPALCVEGIRDRHCAKGSCARFADCVHAERYEYHNGGHSLPSWDEYPRFTANWLNIAAKQAQGEMTSNEAKKARLQLESPYKDVKMRQNHAKL